MPTPPTDLSPVALVAAVLGGILGHEMLPYASVYTVVGVGAFIGALIGLYRRAPCTPYQSSAFIVIMTMIGVGCAAPVAQWLAERLGQPVTWFFFPVATGIAAVGDDWLKIPFGEIVGRLVSLWTKRRGTGNDT